MRSKNVSLEMLISTLLFRFSLIGISCLFVASSFGAREVILKDRFVFKIANEVLSLKDIKNTKKNLDNLQCVYPESLLNKIFSRDFKGGRLGELKKGVEFKKSDIQYFERLIPFYKLMAYSKSHDVEVQQALAKYFKLSARENNCDLSAFEENSFSKAFAAMVRLEVFVRSRFLPSESEGKTSAADIEKAIIGARNLITSIGQQIDEEAYW